MANETSANDTPPVARFDVAHGETVEPHSGSAAPIVTASGAHEPVHNAGCAASGKDMEMVSEQVQRQASELSSKLRARQRELTKWEATLHAQRARWEDEQRASRIWVSEQAAALAKREEELRAWSGRLERRAADLQRAGMSADTLQRRQQDLDDRAAKLTQLEQQLCRERAQVQQQAAWLDAARQAWAAEQTAPTTCKDADVRPPDISAGDCAAATAAADTETVTARLRALEALEKLTRDRLEWFTQAIRDFDEQYRAWHRRTRRQRQHLARIWQRRRRVLAARTASVKQQQEQLAARRRVLGQLAGALASGQPSSVAEPRVHRDDGGSAQYQVHPMIGTDGVATARGVEQLQHLVDQLSAQRRALAKSQQSLTCWAHEREQSIQQHERELQQVMRDVEAAEIRLAEMRRDALHEFQREQRQIQQWLDALRS